MQWDGQSHSHIIPENSESIGTCGKSHSGNFDRDIKYSSEVSECVEGKVGETIRIEKNSGKIITKCKEFLENVKTEVKKLLKSTLMTEEE